MLQPGALTTGIGQGGVCAAQERWVPPPCHPTAPHSSAILPWCCCGAGLQLSRGLSVGFQSRFANTKCFSLIFAPLGAPYHNPDPWQEAFHKHCLQEPVAQRSAGSSAHPKQWFLLSSLGFPLPAHPLLPPAVLSLCSLTQIPAPAMLSHAEPPHSLWISPPSAGLCVTAAQFAHRTHPPPLSGYPSTSSRGFPYVWAAVQCWVLLHTVVFLLRSQSSSHFPSHRAGPMLGHGTLWTGRCL